MTNWIDWVRERAPRGDAGTTLMELVVGMTVMAIFMGIFTATMVSMSNTTSTVQTVADTTNQATNAFLRLDGEVRYASAIGTPAFDSSGNMWHVEFTTGMINRVNGTNTVTNTIQCTQLAVAPPTGSTGSVGILKQRTWTVGASSPGPWTAIANYVSNYSGTTSTPPFPTTTSISGSNASTSMQQLTVSLAFTRSSSSTTVSTYTFTALNSSTSNAAPVCQQFAVGS